MVVSEYAEWFFYLELSQSPIAKQGVPEKEDILNSVNDEAAL